MMRSRTNLSSHLSLSALLPSLHTQCVGIINHQRQHLLVHTTKYIHISIIMSCRLLALVYLATQVMASTPDIPITVPVVSSGGAIGGDDYDALCEKVKCDVLERANKSVCCQFVM